MAGPLAFLSKSYVLVREDLSTYRPLTEEEESSLKRAMQLQPELTRYLLEQDWSGSSLQRPNWSPQRQTWQREVETPYSVKELVLGARPKPRANKRSS